jgi:hypothetical protein
MLLSAPRIGCRYAQRIADRPWRARQTMTAPIAQIGKLQKINSIK